MIASVVPMTFIPATASETATSAVAGTAPATLPDGKTYASTMLFTSALDVMGTYHTKQASSWMGSEAYIGEGVEAMLKSDADGIMFKLDTSAATCSSNDFSLAFVLQVVFGSKNTYICSSPTAATVFGEGVKDGTQTSTWYYSADGETWDSITTADRYVNIRAGKSITYVYVPMSSFWTKCGESYLKTGTHDKTETIVNWNEAKEMIGTEYYLKASNYYFGGNFTDKITLAQDSATKITEWQIVDHVQSIDDMVTGVFRTRDNDPTCTANTRPNWSGAGGYLETAEASFEAAKGLMFEVDSTSAAEGTDDLAFSVLLAANNGAGTHTGTYLFANSSRVKDYGNCTTPTWASSVWYWSEDGVNWTAITTTGSQMVMPKSRAKAYVYIPLTSFWSRYSARDITGNTAYADNSASTADWLNALGEGWNFSHLHAWFKDTNPANAAAKFSNWRFVYPEGTQTMDDGAPVALPNGSYYTTTNFFVADSTTQVYSKSINHASWKGGPTSSGAACLNTADGIMFKADSSAIAPGTDLLSFWFTFSITGNNGRGTYFMSNVGSAPNYSEGVKPANVNSVWYISVDGVTWTAISSNASNFPTTSHRGQIYFYIPFSSAYIKSGATYMSTGTHVKTEECMSFEAATALAGGWKASGGSFRYSTDSTAMAETVLYDFEFVTATTTAPKISEKATDLPVVGETVMADFLTSNINRPSWSGNKNFIDSAEAKFESAKGIMFELDNTAVSAYDPIQMNLMLSLQHASGGNAGNNYLVATAGRAAAFGNSAVPAGTMSTWYISTDGKNWDTVATDDEFMTIPATRQHLYVYIPLEAFWSRYNADYISGASSSYDKTKPSIQYDEFMSLLDDDWIFAYINTYWGAGTTSASSSCTTSNWKFVYDNSLTGDATTAVPGVDVYSSSLFYQDSFDVMASYAAFVAKKEADGKPDYTQIGWAGSNILAANAATKIKNGADGIMFTIDTSDATSADNLFNMSFALQINFSGRNTYLVATAKLATDFGEAKKTDADSSTWYYSVDGVTWTAVTARTTSRMEMNVGKGIAYVYVPMDAFWTKCGETYLKTGTHVKTENIIPWSKAVEMLPSDWSFGMSNFYFGGTASKNTLEQDAATKIYDWKVVSEAGLKTHSTTVKNDFTYNVYANDAVNSAVTFTMGGKTYEAVGVAQSNGTVKYSFDNLLPQQLAEEITTTWTTTLSTGKTVTETKTFSVYDYLKATLADESLSDWHELAQATLNYAAAVQAREGSGFKGEPIPAEDVKPLENAVTDYTTLDGYDTISLALGAESGFNSAALLLEGTILMKISVADTITAIKYEINGRTGTATVEDGAAYVPVNAYEMASTITVTDANNAADVLTVSVNWYIANVSGGAATKTLINAIANYGVAAAKMK